MAPNKGFGERVRQIRQQLKLTQEEFGKKFTPPASKGIVSRWEHGGTPNNARLERIAELGHVSVDYLLSGRAIDDILPEHTFEKFIHSIHLTESDMPDLTRENKDRVEYIRDWFDLTLGGLVLNVGNSDTSHRLTTASQTFIDNIQKVIKSWNKILIDGDKQNPQAVESLNSMTEDYLNQLTEYINNTEK